MRRLLIPLAALALAGCSDGFYLSESEVSAYRANLRTEFVANRALQAFEGDLIRLEFGTRAGRLRITRSNILETLRAVPVLFWLHEGGRHIDLDRLSRQLELDLEDWIGDELLQPYGDPPARLRLDWIEVEVLSAPEVTFHAARQLIEFALTVRVTIDGAIDVPEPDGAFAFIERLLVPHGNFDITAEVDDYEIEGAFHLAAPSRPIRLRVRPLPGQVSVDTANNDVAEAVLRMLERQLAVPVDKNGYPVYDRFALTQVRLDESEELELEYVDRPEVALPVVDVVARGDDGKLYHAQRVGKSWTDPTELPLPVTPFSDPVLVSPAPGWLEVAAISDDGALVHVTRRDGRWGASYVSSRDAEAVLHREPFSPTLEATQPKQTQREPEARRVSFSRVFPPALVATAPGQLEIVAVGSDELLYHLRRVNGRWLAPVVIEGATEHAEPPLQRPVAARSGNKIVLAFVDRSSRLFRGVFDLYTSSWGPFEEIPGRTVLSRVALASCGDGEVDLMFLAVGGYVAHHSVSSSGTYGPETNLGADLIGTPALVCSGFRRLTVWGVGRDRHPRQAGRNTSGLWWGWNVVKQRFFGNFIGADEMKVAREVAAAGSSTGQTHVLSRSYSRRGRPTRMVHNRRRGDGMGWRGWQKTADRRYLGAPAMSVTGDQLELIAARSDGELQHGTVIERSRPRFDPVFGTEAELNLDPLLLTSAPGVLDLLFVGRDALGRRGVLYHQRRVNGSWTEELPVPQPPSPIVKSPTAVSFGAGQIELVALCQDGVLRHWSFINGQWRAPTPLPALRMRVSSAPVLVDQGAGQMSLLAVGEDSRLYRWSFQGILVHEPHRVPTDFSVAASRFGRSAAVSPGDGLVDVVLVESGGRAVHYGRLPATDPPPEDVFVRLEIESRDVPVLTAFSPERLHLMVPGADQRLYSAWAGVGFVPGAPPRPSDFFTGPPRFDPRELEASSTLPRIVRTELRWTGFRALSYPGQARWLGGVVLLSDERLAAVAAGNDSKLRLARFQEGRWSAFSSAPGQPNWQRMGRPAITRH